MLKFRCNRHSAKFVGENREYFRDFWIHRCWLLTPGHSRGGFQTLMERVSRSVARESPEPVMIL